MGPLTREGYRPRPLELCWNLLDGGPSHAARPRPVRCRYAQPPTAFIYETDTMAAASLRALSSIMLTSDMLSWDSGIRRFPYDLPAIVSFEDSAICESAFPSITAVHRDASLYGTKVANLLLKVLAGEPVAGNRKILTPKLIVRESTRMTLPAPETV